MKELAEKKYWDSVHESSSKDKKGESSLRSWLKHITRDYSNYLIWEVLLERYLPKNKSLKVMEVGCAPGKYLIKLHQQFGYEPYGVEYSEEGLSITKSNFERQGLSSGNIIKADFFDNEFLSKNKGKYDVVFSRGFIEHYDDVVAVVERHTELLKEGGYLIISIPNLSKFNNCISRFSNPEIFKLHNLSIMNPAAFKNLFSESKLEHLYCDYIGIFSFGKFNTDRKWKYYIWRVLLLIQRPFDFLFRVLFRSWVPKFSQTAPYLLFIGKKK